MSKAIKGLLISLIILTLIGTAGLSFAWQTKYATGDGVFTHSERMTRQVHRRVIAGRFNSLDDLVYTGMALFPPQGTPVKIQSYYNGIYRVKFPNSQTVWYVLEDGLMSRPSPHFGGMRGR